MNGIRPCDSVDFAAGLTSLYSGDGDSAATACLHAELSPPPQRQENPVLQ